MRSHVRIQVNERTGSLIFKLEPTGVFPRISEVPGGYQQDDAANRHAFTIFGYEQLGDVEAWLEHCLSEVRLARSEDEALGQTVVPRWIAPSLRNPE